MIQLGIVYLHVSLHMFDCMCIEQMLHLVLLVITSEECELVLGRIEGLSESGNRYF